MSMKENANIIPKLNKVVKKIHKNYQSLPDDSIPSKLHELLIVPTICLTLSTKMKKLHKEQRALVTKLRNKCVDIVHNIITKYSSNAPLEILLPSYNQLLQLWINNIEARDNIKDIVTILPIYLKYSMDTIQIKSKGDAHSFIMLVTRNQKHFMDNLPENFVLDLWDVYYKINCNIQNISSTETVLALLESCDDKQFEEIILKLNDNTIKSMECEKDFPNSINLWVNITEAMLSGNKTKLRLEILTKLCQDLLALITKGHYTNGTNTLVIMKFFLAITKNPLCCFPNTF
ncbi:uncharacterized protein LOC113373368 [Ctenocephalides felis]|uniref:uncharacterized protein LOC113373368 n=1 Tax=Ctenocephalides felis TaxID=7515 RepID=UPI000E6E207D|nr:uncharacterized protein LOC113373368 [Ctenocephalides felis]